MAQKFTFLLLFLFISFHGLAQISASQENGCLPLINVNFSFSNPLLTNHYWDFDDGTFSLAPSPVHTFTNAGTYMVVLTGIFNSTAVSDSIEINVFSNPTANFFVDGPNTGCAALSIDYKDISTSAFGSPIVSRFWTFGDGTFADTSLVEFTHTYYDMGIYSVSLMITDTNGCQDLLYSDSIVIASSPPVVVFGNDLDSLIDCNPPVNVNFYANTYSLFQHADTFSYLWDLGNGQSSVLANPVYDFQQGYYQGSLQVTDNFGCSVEHQFSFFVILPEASFELANATDYVICDTAFFINTSNVPSVWLNYGDGNTGSNLTHIYSLPGVYNVQMFAALGNCTDDTTIQVTVEDVQADYGLSPDYTCSTPIGVQYSDSSFNAVEWLWLFPNGDTSLLQNPYIIYSDPDTSLCEQTQVIPVNPVLIVTSPHGCHDTLLNGNTFVFDMPVSRFMPDVSWGF
ncbi:MAG: PKD domain-containing protein, partial [Bacteroidota bacterium]|nr:PKD domain-containing protein [Bacteroidota bacterium]